MQRDALEAAGCEKVIVNTMSRAASARSGLAQLKDILRSGDTLVVWRFDRLGRLLKVLIAWVGLLEEREVGLRSRQEAIDTTTPIGKLTFHVFGTLAVKLYNKREMPIAKVCHTIGILKPTLYNCVRADNGVTDGLAAK